MNDAEIAAHGRDGARLSRVDAVAMAAANSARHPAPVN
jgi:hypothetical protein